MTNTATGDVPGRAAYFVQSVGRAFAILRCFGADTPAMTASAAARQTGLDRATARRLLLTLADLGYVRHDGRTFRLAPRTLELGHDYLSGLTLPTTAQPHLHDLARRLTETTSLTVLDGDDVVHLAVVPGHRHVLAAMTPGARQPAHLTSGGWVLFAALPDDQLGGRVAEPELAAEIARTRDRGWAMAAHDLGEGVRSIAAPVRRRRGPVVAAVNATVHPDRAEHGVVERDFVPELLRTAWAIEADLAKLPE